MNYCGTEGEGRKVDQAANQSPRGEGRKVGQAANQSPQVQKLASHS